MAATFIAIMDSFIVNVALPSIRADLDASYAQTELAVAGYVLVYGLLLVTGGRLGDLFGYRSMFLAGLALFTAASLACGLAPSPEFLVAARVVQAAGAALFYPQVLSVLQTAFDGSVRTRAFSVFGATIGLASVAGQLVGGALVSADLFGLSWRPIFLINLPVGVATLLLAAAVLPAARAAARPGLDLCGVALLSAALLLVSVPLVQGQAAGWPLWAWGMLVLAVPGFVSFAVWERRLAGTGGLPLLPPSLFRLPGFTAGTVLALVFFAGNAGLFFVLTLHLQGGMGYSPLVAGLTFTPLAVAFVAASLLAPRIQERVGLRVLILGYAANAAGTLVLLGCALAFGSGLSGWIMAPALAVIGFGEGLGVSPLFGAVLARVPQSDAGAASGVVETTTQIGMSFGVTVLGLVFAVGLEAGAGPADSTTAFTAALVGTLVLAVAALALAPAVLRGRREPTG